LYHESPIDINLIKVIDSSSSFELRFASLEKTKVRLSVADSELPSLLEYNKPYNYRGVIFSIIKKSDFNIFSEPLAILYEPSLQTARRIAGALSVSAIGKTSVIQIDLRDDNPIRAKEILDKLVSVFQRQDVELKRIASLNTINFINDRLKEVSSEVDSTESEMMALKKKTLFNDVTATYDYSRLKLIGSEDNIERLLVQNEIIMMLQDYLQKPHSNRAVPVDLGIENSFLISSMRDYNNLLLQIEREKNQLAEPDKNIIINDLRRRANEVKSNILEILGNIKSENDKKISINKEKAKTHLSTLSDLPEIEKRIKYIQTQGAIKKELYLYLLKRKEEIGITSATFVSNYDAIDSASASFIPVEPRVNNIRNFSVLIGLVIPILLIYIIDLFNDKVTLREQIIKRVDLPIAGEVSHVASPASFVFSQSRSLVAEQFRILRSNLKFLFRGDEDAKVILISSTISGEGKSFVSSNLAAGISLADKKVALLLFDLRKLNSSPVIDRLVESTSPKGITNFLIGQVDDFRLLKVNDASYPNLDIYPAGPIPPNPAELLLGTKMKSLFDCLRNEYDFIIVDSAPAGLVSDAFILQEFADITLYIIRQQYTLLKQLDFISDLNETNKLKNLSLVVNDVKMGGRYGYYGYNYGYGYGYAFSYKYGYINSKSKYGGYYLTDEASNIKNGHFSSFLKLIGIKK
jgi:capsular exopolysaccharide synthesis family protein